jgi:cytochrome o ubiquinol oxidase subunit 2
VLLLSGCSNLDILNPKGSVGLAERDLIATSTWAMLIVVVPVIFLTLLFAWRYRASNRSAEYRPKWVHSTGIEIAIWTIPTLIILFLAVLTWKSTHELDPYRPLESQVKPINVEVVALDWKWLFIYPDLGIASVNQLAIPVGTPELRDHLRHGDELVLHPAARRPDLRDGRHANATASDRGRGR